MDFNVRLSGKASIDLNVQINADAVVAAIRDGITAITLNTRSNIDMSKELDDLTAQVAADGAIESSAVTMIQGLAAQITAAGTDQAALSALTTELQTNSGALAAAITANTPAAAPPAPAAASIV